MATTTTQEKILIVDDTLSAVDLLTNTLEAEGYQLFVATNGEKAIKVAKLNSPDLILLDIQMPGINGFETCSRLKAEQHTKTIPVIFMTGLSETKDKVRGLRLGAVDFITKPIQIEELLARVSTHLEIRRYRRHLEEEVRIRTLEKEEAEAASKKMVAILDAVTVGVWEYDVASGVLEFDDVMYRLYGVSRENYPNPLDVIESLVHPEDKNKVPPGILDRIRQGESHFSCQLRVLHPKEAIRYLHTKITVKRTLQGIPVKVFGTEEFSTFGLGVLNSRPTIVALGASAGGLEAISQFFDHMPQNPGLVFVIATHQAIDSPRDLNEFFSPHTDMPVFTITDETMPTVNTIYVVPGDKGVVIENGILKLHNKIQERMPTVIDKLFISLSKSEKRNAVAIIFSGMLHDGVAGIKEIKKRGGMTAAQDPNTTRYPSMPQLAINSGNVDFILPANKMPLLLLKEIKREDPAYQDIIQRLERLTYTYGSLKNQISNIDSSILSSILILDHDLRIKSFAGPINRVLPVIEPDIGRPITDLILNLDYQTLASDTQQVLRTAQTKELETIGANDQKYLVRIALNHNSMGDSPECIVSFIPINDRE